MSSLSRMVAAVLVMSLACVAQTTIKVCADPDNLPYSNRRLQGYENKIAQLIIADLKAKPAFSFTRQRRGFIRSQFNKHACDLITGVPAQFRPVLTTEPYLRSTYVFVSRKDRNLRVSSLNDPRFEQWRIGLHVVGTAKKSRIPWRP